MDLTFNMSTMSEETNSFETITPGRYTLKIASLDQVVATTSGSTMIQFNYDIVDSKAKVNYDNCPVRTASGEVINFGEVKLKKIMEAAGLDPKVPYTTAALKQILVGKFIDADLEVNDKGYANIEGTKIFKSTKTATTEVSPEQFMGDVTFNENDL